MGDALRDLLMLEGEGVLSALTLLRAEYILRLLRRVLKAEILSVT